MVFPANGATNVPLDATIDWESVDGVPSYNITLGTTPGGDDISLSTSGYKSKGTKYIDLSWSGAATSTVDVYRNGSKVGSVANTNSYTDTITTKGGGTYTYQVCEAQSTTVCSNNSTVTF